VDGGRPSDGGGAVTRRGSGCARLPLHRNQITFSAKSQHSFLRASEPKGTLSLKFEPHHDPCHVGRGKARDERKTIQPRVSADPGHRFTDRPPAWFTWPHLKVLTAIERCRTAAMGGHLDQCSGCGPRAISYNSCRNRHSPKRQSRARDRWLEARRYYSNATTWPKYDSAENRPKLTFNYPRPMQ
jgi:hypothetical protein